MLTRESLLKRDVLEIVKVQLTKDEIIHVRQMTGRERDNFEQSLIKEVRKGKEITYERSLRDFRAKLAVNTICDEKGDLILRPNDYEMLSKNMSAAKLEKIINEAQKINKISEEDKDGLVKN